jgi:hypothetical protein
MEVHLSTFSIKSHANGKRRSSRIWRHLRYTLSLEKIDARPLLFIRVTICPWRRKVCQSKESLRLMKESHLWEEEEEEFDRTA